MPPPSRQNGSTTTPSPPAWPRPKAGNGRAADDQGKLATLIEHGREAVLGRWRQQVRELPSAKALDVPTLNDHIPGLLDELVAALREKSDQTIPAAVNEDTATAHGLQRVSDGFSIEEVVAEYNVLRGCVHDLADSHGLTLQGKPFHTINRVFAQAVGLAAQTFSTQRAREVQTRREEYLSFVAHDLRNPLNAIALAGRALQISHPVQSSSVETVLMLQTLRRNVERIEGMVGRVLKENTHLRTEIGIKLERRELDLWPLVEALMHDLQPVAGTGSTRLVNRVPGDLVVYADADLLKRVFQNLIANAIQYTPRGEIIAGAKAHGTGGAMECWVRDNGAGIPAVLLEKVFDKGETDPGKEGGTGLGLAIVKSFVEAHGGAVTVESKEGAGTTFRFSLPAKSNALKPAAVLNSNTRH